MSAVPVRFAVVGCGVIGTLHARALAGRADAELRAVLDVDPAAAAALAQQVAATGRPAPVVASSLEQLLDCGEVDAVAVCTPSGRHAEVAVPVLRSGRHVLVEKPLEVTVPAALPIRRAAAAAGPDVVAAVVSQHRFDPASVAVRAEIAAGRLGRLGSATATVPWWRADAYYGSAPWRGTRALDGGGALENQGIHTVDLLLWLLGAPVDVLARVARVAHQDIEVEDVVAAVLRFASGALATVHATTAAAPGLTVRIAVHGDRGSAVLDNDRLDYLHTRDRAADDRAADDRAGTGGSRGLGGTGNQAGSVVAASEVGRQPGGGPGTSAMLAGHRRQYDDLLRAITTGSAPGVGVDDGIRALATVRAVYRSAESGRAVTVADELGTELAGLLGSDAPLLAGVGQASGQAAGGAGGAG